MQLAMPKVEGDPRTGDAAAAGKDARSSSNAESPAVKRPADRTVPNQVPPMHVLVAAERQDRKETEELLAGFDRPGRGPKKSGADRDFVAHYAKKKGGPDSGRAPASGPAAATLAPRQIDVVTVIKPRQTESAPAWVVWLGAAILMLGVGGVVAYVATGDARPNASTPTASIATTTISATTPMQSSRDVIPAPAPPEPTTTTTTPVTVTEAAPSADPPAPRPSRRRDPRSAPSGASTMGAAAAGATAASSIAAPKPPPRDDFIRDM